MKNLWNTMQFVIATLGGWLGYFLGGCDGLVYALIAFVVIDLNRSNAPALLAKSRACERLQPTLGALAPQGFSGRLQLPLKL